MPESINTKTVSSDKVVVHVLYMGRSLCGVPPGEPSQWPAGHIWCRPTRAIIANCMNCQRQLKEGQVT